ncbi:MAG: PQQ-binding-like beta-propeller repeat protein [Pirellula sp.]|nr:PQQ-binding-like beta-propeller repeat protein [Pirellula sp.]
MPTTHRLYPARPIFAAGLSILLSILCLGFLSSAAYGDWPEFRGPNQNGILSALRLPTEWSENKNVIWFSPTKGLGWSSPVIARDKIYFTASFSENASESNADLSGAQSLKLLCLDASTGKPIFEKSLLEQPANAPSIHKKNSHASPTPLLHEGKLYVHFGHQGTVCTDLDGNIVWSNREHSYPPTHGNGGSPIVVNDLLILTCDGGETPYTLALDLKTGNERWRTPRGITSERTFSFCTPQLITVGNQQQIISPGSDIVQSISPIDGSVIWSVRYEGFSVIPRPLYHKGLVYISTGYMIPKLLAIDPTGRGDTTKTHLKWTYKGGVPNTPSFVVSGDQILLVSDAGIAASVDATTGKENWKKRIGGNYSASLMLVDDKLYFQGETGEAIVFRVGSELEEIARNTLPGRIFSSYAVIDNDWIIRAEGGVYRIGNR